MFPLIMIAVGMFTVGFVGVFTVKGVSNVVNANKSSDSVVPENNSDEPQKQEEKNKEKSLEETKELDRTRDIEGRVQENRELESDDIISQVIESIKSFIKELRTNKNNEDHAEIVNKKISSMDSIDEKYRLDETCKHMVTSVLEEKYEEKVNETILKAEELISRIDMGENVENVIKEMPEKPNFEDFVNNNEELINSVVNDYKMYTSAIDEVKEEIIGDKVDEENVVLDEEINNVDIEVVEEPREKITKEEALTILNEYKTYISRGINQDEVPLSAIVEANLNNIKLNDDSNKNKELVSNSMTSAWNSIVTAAVSKVDSLIENVNSADDDFEKYVDKMPSVDYDWFASKGCAKVVDRTSEKYKMYYDLVRSIAPQLQSIKNSDGPVASKINEYVFSVLGNLEKRIVSSKISVEQFSMDIEREMIALKNEFNNIGRFSDVEKDVSDIQGKIKEINDTLVKHSGSLKKMNDLELQEIKDKVYELAMNSDVHNVQIINLWKSLAKEMATRDRQVTEIRSDMKKSLKMIRKTLSKKVDVDFVSDELKVIGENLKVLSVVDLLSLSETVKKLQESFSGVEKEAKLVVEKEIQGLDDKIKDFVRRSIAVRVGKKMKDLESKNQKEKEKIVDEIVGKLNNSTRELTEEEINKVVDSVINSIKISKK